MKKRVHENINAVWIEFDEVNTETVPKMNALLERLGITQRFELVVYTEEWKDDKLTVVSPGDGSYYDCVDKGHWFNLDHVAGQTEPVEKCSGAWCENDAIGDGHCGDCIVALDI